MAENIRRFWKDATVERQAEGHGVLLDGRPVRTPAKRLFCVPQAGMAEAVAAEWRAQGESVDPLSMPVTRAVNAALDRVAPEYQAVAEIVSEYGETDLLCYRAPHPEALQQRQADLWDPWLGWVRDSHGARLVSAAGVMHVEQTPDAVAALAAAVRTHDPFELTALHELVSLTGSLVLGLAVSARALEAAEAWPLGRVEEDWQIEEWGEDAEAAAAVERRRADFMAADRFLALARGAPAA